MARQYTRIKTPRVLITNAKGGSGKTTLTTNLAAYYAQQRNVVVMDFDAQQSSTHWALLRDAHLKPVQVLPGYKPNQLNQTRSWQLRTPPQCDLVFMDTPAAMPDYALEEVIQYSDIILIPVLPSVIDIKAAEQFIYKLLQTRAYREKRIPVGIVANRVRQNTKIFNTLSRFLTSLELPVITIIRDTQQFIKAYEQGLGITELNRMSPTDRRALHLLTHWLDQRVFPESIQLASINESMPRSARQANSVNDASSFSDIASPTARVAESTTATSAPNIETFATT